MRPLAQLSDAAARALHGVVFDLDDTVLDRGRLGEAAYSALFRLRETGLRLVACTGRPALWAELVARQWPVDLAVAENGAVAFAPTFSPGGAVGASQVLGPDRREAELRRKELFSLAERVLAAHPESALADDNEARLTDVTLDIGEHRRVAPDSVRRMRQMARAHGASTTASSVHLHLAFDRQDKASGTLTALAATLREDPARARRRYAFVGDSGNDASCFAAFSWSFGVANVREHLGELTVPPAFVAPSPRGTGFAEIAARIVEARGPALQSGADGRA